VLDFGWFVELEGPAEVLPEMARSMGLDIARSLRDSYSVMARKYLKTNDAKKLAPVTTVTPPAPVTA
jgi:hypothetical protein